MSVRSCIPVVPSFDLENSLRLWRDGLGFDETWYEMHDEGRLIGCGLRKGEMAVMLNRRAGGPVKPDNYEGVRFYWTPEDLAALHEKLAGLGFAVGRIHQRDYGQTEFVLIDDDGFSHCFGVAS